MSKSMSEIDESLDSWNGYSQRQGNPETIRPEALPDEPESAARRGREYIRPEARPGGDTFLYKRTKGSPKNSSSTIVQVTWQTVTTIISAAVIVATLFTIWTPGSLLAKNLPERMVEALAVKPLADNTPDPALSMPSNFPSNKVGIVVGHRGNDSGAVCSNGLTELEINTNVATYLQKMLIDDGYEVELLDEFDARLSNYEAGLLISIHADSCDYINDSATGFKVASALSETKEGNSQRLVACIADRYAEVTGLKYHYQSVTTDMTYYHAFSEISQFTTAAIIEVGFMNLDQTILTTEPDLLAKGIREGIKCYMDNEDTKASP